MTEQPVSKHIDPALIWGILLTSLVGVVAFHMPWHDHAVAAFRLNAFDLAEWGTLHPTIRLESPTLWSSLLLRWPLLGLGLSMAISANHLRDERWRWIWRGIAILVVLRLNPPIEFYKGPGSAGDNEQQLGYLTLVGLVSVLVLIGTQRWLNKFYWPILLVIWLSIGYGSWEGLRRITLVVESLAVEVNYGGGFYLMMSLVVGIIGLAIGKMIQIYRR